MNRNNSKQLTIAAIALSATLAVSAILEPKMARAADVKPNEVSYLNSEETDLAAIDSVAVDNGGIPVDSGLVTDPTAIDPTIVTDPAVVDPSLAFTDVIPFIDPTIVTDPAIVDPSLAFTDVTPVIETFGGPAVDFGVPVDPTLTGDITPTDIVPLYVTGTDPLPFVRYDAVGGVSPEFASVASPSAVPEPASLTMLAIGAVALLGRRGKK